MPGLSEIFGALGIMALLTVIMIAIVAGAMYGVYRFFKYRDN